MIATVIRPDFSGTYRLRAPSWQTIRSVTGGGEDGLPEQANGSVAVTLKEKRKYQVGFADGLKRN